jgi:hypothetical protein
MKVKIMKQIERDYESKILMFWVALTSYKYKYMNVTRYKYKYMNISAWLI